MIFQYFLWSGIISLISFFRDWEKITELTPRVKEYNPTIFFCVIFLFGWAIFPALIGILIFKLYYKTRNLFLRAKLKYKTWGYDQQRKRQIKILVEKAATEFKKKILEKADELGNMNPSELEKVQKKLNKKIIDEQKQV